ncbi:alkaline phosphatase [Nocardioides sp.]|uniref:alkaline phosphatase family protein n=1 Tax=Nocardioides sp. TaxID=35761 RepID=UPI00286C9553|nr:alkaline phosphatase [Nocardioides sp.]
MSRTRALRARTAALCLAPLLAATGCGSMPAAGTPTSGAPPTTAPARAFPAQVLAISIDALNPRALTKLGRDSVPHLWRLLDEGAGTLNARSELEMTLTLPNHTGMVTGRRITASKGGHGVTWNDDRPGTTVQAAAGHPVSSVFTVVHEAGGTTALFSTKTKFSLFDRSWPGGLDRSLIKEEQDAALVKAARADLVQRDRAFTFLHLGIADQTGHASGFMSPAYLRAVETADALVGRMLAAIDDHPDLSDVVVVLTADHGGSGESHSDPTKLANYRVPFVVWGPGVDHGDLYAMNATYADPGTSRPGLTGPQPIRNGDLANLALDLLGLGPVPGSRFDVRQRLDVTAD